MLKTILSFGAVAVLLLIRVIALFVLTSFSWGVTVVVVIVALYALASVVKLVKIAANDFEPSDAVAPISFFVIAVMGELIYIYVLANMAHNQIWGFAVFSSTVGMLKFLLRQRKARNLGKKKILDWVDNA